MKEFYNNYKYIIVGVSVWVAIQLFKTIYDSISHKKLMLRRFWGSGGMPSSHSAVVMCLSILVGKHFGFDSPIFALSMVFAFVVMYDAAGVRRAAGKQATLLNKIVNTPGLTGLEVQEKLVEVLGHTPVQVFVGALIGVLVGAIFG